MCATAKSYTIEKFNYHIRKIEKSLGAMAWMWMAIIYLCGVGQNSLNFAR
jgi:hypothetical protein